MNIKQMDAANAYGQALKSLQGGASAPREGADGFAAGSSAFSSLVNESLGEVKASAASLELTSAQSLTGQADLVDVATAVSNAEMAVETVVTVRDKVIGAYNDILKMPI